MYGVNNHLCGPRGGIAA